MNPEQFIPPQFTPPSGSQMPTNTPNMSGTSEGGLEHEGRLKRGAKAAASIRKTTSHIKNARRQFKDYLLQHGMDLMTSARLFNETGDFVRSSFIAYANYPEVFEPLGQFVQRYPQFQQICTQIQADVKDLKGSMILDEN